MQIAVYGTIIRDANLLWCHKRWLVCGCSSAVNNAYTYSSITSRLFFTTGLSVFFHLAVKVYVFAYIDSEYKCQNMNDLQFFLFKYGASERIGHQQVLWMIRIKVLIYIFTCFIHEYIFLFLHVLHHHPVSIY